MPTSIFAQKFMDAINDRYSRNSQMWQIEAEPIMRRVYEEACPLIEKRLASYEHLRKYDWVGKQAFYDDERGGIKEIRGGIRSKGYGDHLKDQFIVTTDTEGGFDITNTKTVSSSKGTYNLFELLWHGWGRYNVKQPMGGMTSSQLKRLASMSREEKEAYVMSMGYDSPMHYYYRYAGSWFYNAKSRGGFTPSLHDKFKRYVYDAVDWGVEQAMKNIMERGDDTKAMKEIMESMT
jgi:hypothetical protein